MPRIKKKTASKAKEVETVTQSVETPEEESEFMNEAEAEVLEKDGEAIAEANAEVSSQRMHQVLNLLQDEFDIKNKGFELTGYADKGTKIEATVNNMDFEIKFTLKSNALMRLYKEK